MTIIYSLTVSQYVIIEYLSQARAHGYYDPPERLYYMGLVPTGP
jgi:hypothetical protein